MTRYVFIHLAILLLFHSCTITPSSESGPTAEDLKEVITEKEDSLKKLQAENREIPNQKHYELIQSLLNFYRAYPQDSYAPVCLDKIQMSYSGLGVFSKAMSFADTLIIQYPNYVNRAMVLESQASNYDIFNFSRDTAKVRYYYNLLLTENPKLEKDHRKNIEMRLKHLELDIEQFIKFRSAK
jgi:hypothetical protein